LFEMQLLAIRCEITPQSQPVSSDDLHFSAALSTSIGRNFFSSLAGKILRGFGCLTNHLACRQSHSVLRIEGTSVSFTRILFNRTYPALNLPSASSIARRKMRMSSPRSVAPRRASGFDSLHQFRGNILGRRLRGTTVGDQRRGTEAPLFESAVQGLCGQQA